MPLYQNAFNSYARANPSKSPMPTGCLRWPPKTVLQTPSLNKKPRSVQAAHCSPSSSVKSLGKVNAVIHVTRHKQTALSEGGRLGQALCHLPFRSIYKQLIHTSRAGQRPGLGAYADQRLHRVAQIPGHREDSGGRVVQWEADLGLFHRRSDPTLLYQCQVNEAPVARAGRHGSMISCVDIRSNIRGSKKGTSTWMLRS